jgi:hypothetical protein
MSVSLHKPLARFIVVHASAAADPNNSVMSESRMWSTSRRSAARTFGAYAMHRRVVAVWTVAVSAAEATVTPATAAATADLELAAYVLRERAEAAAEAAARLELRTAAAATAAAEAAAEAAAAEAAATAAHESARWALNLTESAYYD